MHNTFYIKNHNENNLNSSSSSWIESNSSSANEIGLGLGLGFGLGLPIWNWVNVAAVGNQGAKIKRPDFVALSVKLHCEHDTLLGISLPTEPTFRWPIDRG